ncbi:MAG: hypothetical protein ACJ780_31510 [Solirubrobacteraceae bacterium]|jgi:anti-sigma factor RsiW
MNWFPLWWAAEIFLAVALTRLVLTHRVVMHRIRAEDKLKARIYEMAEHNDLEITSYEAHWVNGVLEVNVVSQRKGELT